MEWSPVSTLNDDPWKAETADTVKFGFETDKHVQRLSTLEFGREIDKTVKIRYYDCLQELVHTGDAEGTKWPEMRETEN